MAELLHAGVIDPEVAYGMTRVIGSSMARVASALVDAVSARAEKAGSGRAARSTRRCSSRWRRSGEAFLESFPAILDQVWRRHLQAAARRRLLRTESDESNGVVVGFADLVGFTALAQQVSDEELAEVVDQFERLAYDVVVAGGGRVLKMIGDEVMFLVEDPVAAAEIALGLADASRDAAELSDVRVGLALGPVLEREGDAYGPTVNLASRITRSPTRAPSWCRPSCGPRSRRPAGTRSGSMRPRYLKHIGRVSLAALRRADDAPSTFREAIDERRRVMRESVREQLASRAIELPEPSDPAEPE